MPSELPWVWAGVAAYTAAAAFAVAGVASGRPREKRVLALLAAGVALFMLAIAIRWARVGHGPFISMFEVLSSNLFSLGLICLIAYWRVPVLRPSAAAALPILLILGFWILAAKPVDSHLPPTYETPVLWFHLVLGKIFLGTCLVGVGLSGVILLRRTRVAPCFRQTLPDSALDALTWRFMLLSLVFESFMLIAGAVWAQDAWGRYWAWDPLETWSFLTWLFLVFSLHARTAYKVPPQTGALMVMAVFVLAFLTFFGVPFISTSPHKGVV